MNWVDKPVLPGAEKSLAGVTAGSSYQDYRIAAVSVTRNVLFYDCCPNSPFPALLYEINFKRSNDYYTFKLVLPAIVLTLLSFMTFWLSPVRRTKQQRKKHKKRDLKMAFLSLIVLLQRFVFDGFVWHRKLASG